jgi:tRNA 2-selenouridine synthase
MAWLLATAGFDVQLLHGGYKAYRRFILSEFDTRPGQLIIVGGKTGTGKTKILHALRAAGEQIIDLEALAHHKGSAFGAIGEPAQPSFEQFSNDLYAAFAECQPQRNIWLESESKAIGKLQIPAEFWQHMCKAPMIEVQTSLEQRLHHLMEIYAGFPREALEASFRKLTKRLGSQQVSIALAALEADDYAAAARIALAYYDKAYTHSLLSMNHGQYIPFQTSQINPTAIAAELIALAKQPALWTNQ